MQDTQKYLCDCGRLPNVSCMGVPRGLRNKIECFAEATLSTPMQDPLDRREPPPPWDREPVPSSRGSHGSSREAGPSVWFTNDGSVSPGSVYQLTPQRVDAAPKCSDYLGVKVPSKQMNLMDYDTDPEVI